MIKTKQILACMALALIIVSSGLQAGVIDLDASEDTYVTNQFRSTSNGASDSLLLRNDGSSGYNRQAYLQFDLSSITETITAATFDIGLLNNTPSGGKPPGYRTFGISGYMDWLNQ